MSGDPDNMENAKTDGTWDALDEIVEPTESKKTAMDLKVAAVIPMHQVPGIEAKRGRGRPKKIQKKPTPDDLTYHAMMQEAQTEYVDGDALVEASAQRKGTTETLYLLKERLSRLAATLEFRRIEDEKYGGTNSPQIISRTAAVLRDVAQIELRIREMDAQLLDPRSEPIQKLMNLFIEKIQTIASESLPKEHFDILFNQLEVGLEGWEEEAENLFR